MLSVLVFFIIKEDFLKKESIIQCVENSRKDAARRATEIDRERERFGVAQVGWVRWSGRVCGYVGTGTSRASEYTCRGAMDGSLLTERVSPATLLYLPPATPCRYPTLPYPDCLSIRTRSLPTRTHSRAPCTDSVLIVALTRRIPHTSHSSFCFYLMATIQ